METLFGILVFIGLIFLVAYCIKGSNVIWGIFITALYWVIITWLGFKFASPEFIEANAEAAALGFMGSIKKVFQTGLEDYGGDLIRVLFGAWFGAVLVKTNIAQSLIKRVVELGGDKPSVVAVLLTIVVAVLFTSINGIGPTIAIGLIVLPIFTSVGVSPKTAVLAFNFGLASGKFLNASIINGIMPTFTDISYQDFIRKFGWVGFVVALLFSCAAVAFLVTREQKVHAWAAPAANEMDDESQVKSVPLIALLIPLLPVILMLFFNTPNIPTFLFCGFVGALLTGTIKSFKDGGTLLTGCFHDAVTDSAVMIGFLVLLQLCTKSATFARPFLLIVMKRLIPNSLIIIIIVVAILTPLALFRGPLNFWGAGAGVLVAIIALGYFDPTYMFILFMAPSITIANMCCPTQSNVAWSCNYVSVDAKSYLKHSVPYGWILSVLLIVASIIVCKPF